MAGGSLRSLKGNRLPLQRYFLLLKVFKEICLKNVLPTHRLSPFDSLPS